jgi:hypothetical protein
LEFPGIRDLFSPLIGETYAHAQIADADRHLAAGLLRDDAPGGNHAFARLFHWHPSGHCGGG